MSLRGSFPKHEIDPSTSLLANQAKQMCITARLLVHHALSQCEDADSSDSRSKSVVRVREGQNVVFSSLPYAYHLATDGVDRVGPSESPVVCKWVCGGVWAWRAVTSQLGTTSVNTVDLWGACVDADMRFAVSE